MGKVVDIFVVLLFRITKVLFFFFPRKFCLFLGRTAGLIFFHLDKRHRSIALSNLKIAFGSKYPPPELKKIAKNSFKHFGEVLWDLIKISQLNDKERSKLITCEGEENLQRALKKGKGVLILSAHYGNWEIASTFISKKAKLNVIARFLDNKLLENEILKFRISSGAKVIYKHQAAREVLRSLHGNEIVAILIDQNVLQDQAVFVDFFGKQAGTTPSLATFHIRTGSPIIPAFCYPSSSRKYHIEIQKPLRTTITGNTYQDIKKITQQCTEIIEARIRKKPDFWLWFHNRWKSQPENRNNAQN